jgi:hypothetical protein
MAEPTTEQAIEPTEVKTHDKNEEKRLFQEAMKEANRGGQFLQVNEDYYLLNMRWFQDWKNFVGYNHLSNDHHSFSTLLISNHLIL